MFLYFVLSSDNLNDFCESCNLNNTYKIGDIVKIKMVSNDHDKKILICKMYYFNPYKKYLILKYLDICNVFEKCDSIELVSFKNDDEYLRVKILNSFKTEPNLYTHTSDLFKYINNIITTENKIINKLDKQYSWNYKPLNMIKEENKMSEIKVTNKLEEQFSWICKPLSMTKKETKMTGIKDIKKNGPATIIFWINGEKTVVKCQPGDQDDVEKGIIMALVKGIVTRQTNKKNWTSVFDIPYADEIDIEKVIGLAIIKDYCAMNDLENEWYYNYVLKYMYNIIGYTVEDKVKALKARNYSVERIARCLGITKGLVKDILEIKKKVPNKKPKITVTNINPYEVPDHEPRNIDELPKKQKDVISDRDIIDLFNKGYSINKISKELGLTEYFVKKYLDAYTNPKTEKKADKILKKAVKNSKKEKKPRGGYHKRLTEIAFPSYLTEEESQDILEKTKVKYEGKYKCMSELQKYFIRECKHFAINKFYGNGYSAFELGQMLGVSAGAIMRMRNNPI